MAEHVGVSACVSVMADRCSVCVEALTLRAAAVSLWSRIAADITRMSHTAAQAAMRDILDCELQSIREGGTWKTERIIVTSQGPSIRVHGRHEPVLNFCANNYLGLSVSICCKVL